MTFSLNIKFVGYTSTPEIYFKDASLHIFPTIAEAFPMVLSETKIYGIPNILVGIDYVSASKEGVVIVYDDNPKIIASTITAGNAAAIVAAIAAPISTPTTPKNNENNIMAISSIQFILFGSFSFFSQQ